MQAAIGVMAPFPGFVEPELATSADKLPSGKCRLHQIKFDDYRVQLHVRNEDEPSFTRRGNDWTKRFKQDRQ
jgi:bifunctional non-homologous end joining protein LigD